MSRSNRAVRSTPPPAPGSQQNFRSSRATRELQDLVDGVGVVLSGAEAIDRLGHVLDELGQARLVVRGDQRPRSAWRSRLERERYGRAGTERAFVSPASRREDNVLYPT